MGILDSITAACYAFAAYVNYKIKLAPIDTDAKADATEDEIFKLSRSTDDFDQRRIPLLTARTARLREQARQLANLPTYNPSTESGSASANSAGNIHPASG